jgi:hypothetical protein
MFEQLEEEEKEEKQERKKIVQMTTYIVAALVVVIVIVYLVVGRQAKAPQPVKSPAAASKPKPAPDPVNDLHLIHAKMGKDPWGVRVRWSVQVRNISKVYTYRDIRYDAYFLDKDGVRLGEEHNVIKDSIGPGEEKQFPEFLGGNYEARGSTYQFVIAGATVAAP